MAIRADGVWLDKRVQIIEQAGIGFGQRFAPVSRTTNAARRQQIRRFNVFQAASDRARGDTRHTRYRGYPKASATLLPP